jgi:hypothetical protein
LSPLSRAAPVCTLLWLCRLLLIVDLAASNATEFM